MTLEQIISLVEKDIERIKTLIIAAETAHNDINKENALLCFTELLVGLKTHLNTSLEKQLFIKKALEHMKGPTK